MDGSTHMEMTWFHCPVVERCPSSLVKNSNIKQQIQKQKTILIQLCSEATGAGKEMKLLPSLIKWISCAVQWMNASREVNDMINLHNMTSSQVSIETCVVNSNALSEYNVLTDWTEGSKWLSIFPNSLPEDFVKSQLFLRRNKK